MTIITANNRYDVMAICGQGAFGEISMASDQNGNFCAIKKIGKNKNQFENIIREVRAGQVLCHPNIVKFVEHLEDEENDFLIFEYIRGNFFVYFSKTKTN